MTTDPQPTESHSSGPMSIKDYLQLDGNAIDARYEYLDGIARLMSGGSGEHDRIARNVASGIEKHLLSGPCTVFGSNVQVLIGLEINEKEHYVYPDATVSCDVADGRRGNTLVRSPQLIVEVLSPSTERIDRGQKLEAYKNCRTIQEIVLISQFEQSVEIYRRGDDETFWNYSFYGPGSTVELTSISIHLSMDEIYKGINFDEPLVGE